MISDSGTILAIALLWAHVIADGPLNTATISKGKRPWLKEGRGLRFVVYHLMHSFIHAGFVLLITGSIALAAAEFVVHLVTDALKVADVIDARLDQFIHIVVKFLWAAIAVGWHV